MEDANEGLAQIVTSCPHCGQVSWVSATETLAPQVCTHCQQVHVATLNLESAEGAVSPPPGGPHADGQPAQTLLGQISRYQVTRILGSGTFGVVYQAWDPSLHRWVAIKVPRLVQRGKEFVEDFLKEARTAAQLRHPRIVSIFDAQSTSGQPYIIAEYVEGDTLAAQISKGPLPPRRAARIVYEIAVALQYAHQQGVIHRDIKPGNVMIDSQGQSRLMDFGLAQYATEILSPAEGKLSGTPAYMAPELARGKQLGGALSDQYSLGVILFECLVGHRPFDGELQTLLRKIASQTPPRPRELNADIPPELDEICTRMMAREPEQRFADLGVVAKRLSSYLKPPTDNSPTIPKQAPAHAGKSPFRRQLAIIGVAAVLSLVGIGSGLLIWKNNPDRPATAQNEIPIPPTTAAIPTPAVDTVPQPELTAPSVATAPIAPVPQSSPVTVPPDPAPMTPSAETVPLAGEPAADALAAIQFAAQERDENEFVSTEPTYPTFRVAPGSSQPASVLKEFQSLLEQGFPESSKRLDDETFAKIVSQYAALKRAAPHEPRLPYALSLIRGRYLPGRGVNKDLLPDELELLKESQQLGGYPFLPAYLSEVDYWLSRPKPNIEAAKDALVAVAAAIDGPALWPDPPERLRVAIWLGRAYGFYASGISGKAGHDLVMIKSQDSIESKLPKELRGVFLNSMLETQTQIADSQDAKENQARQAESQQLAATKEKLDKNIADQGAVAGDLAQVKLEGEALEQWFEGTIKPLEAAYDALERRSTDIQLQAAPLFDQFRDASADADRAQGNLNQLQADLNNGTLTDASLLGPAQQALAQALARVAAINAQLQALNAQDQELRRRAAGVIREAEAAESIYRQSKGKTLGKAAFLKQKLTKLDKNAKATAAQALKLPANVLKDRRLFRDFRYWVQWSSTDARNWLQESMTDVVIEES